MIADVLIILGILIIFFELWGVWRNKRGEVDTISELWWALKEKVPTWAQWVLNIAMTLGLLWLIPHFWLGW